MRSSLSNVLAFLSDSFLAGKAFATLNCYRSMLSVTLLPIDGTEVGKHPAVTKLMKGIFNSNPPRAKYSGTWDVDLVLRYLVSLPENENLPLIQLSRKTAILLALVTLFRVSEIASIDLQSIVFSSDDMRLSLLKPRKAQKSGALVSKCISRLQVNKICPVETTQAYINATKSLRKPPSSSLLVSSIKPHKPIGGATVGHWIKKVMQDAGVDTSVFSAHSTRGAASSKAAAKGVPTDTILSTASWASESTFVKFYRREVQQPDAGATVLSL